MPDSPRILIIEDEAPIRRFLRASLRDAGYQIDEAETGKLALIMVRNQPPDVVVLDLGLPDMDGLRIIEDIRSWSQLPILILSARDQEKDKIAALDLGADDYLAKPFSAGELLARIRVALRHAARRSAAAPADADRFTVAELAVDLAARRVTLAGVEVHLTPIEYRLLTTLIQHAGKVLTHRAILHDVWGPGHADEVHQLRVHMANLRRKIESDPARPRYILTEQAVGYRLAPE